MFSLVEGTLCFILFVFLNATCPVSDVDLCKPELMVVNRFIPGLSNLSTCTKKLSIQYQELFISRTSRKRKEHRLSFALFPPLFSRLDNIYLKISFFEDVGDGGYVVKKVEL